MDVDILTEVFTKPYRGHVGVWIAAISDGMALVGRRDGLHDIRMDTGMIVAG